MNKFILLISVFLLQFTVFGQENGTQDKNTKIKIEEVDAQIHLDSANRNVHQIPNLPRQIEVKEQKYTSQKVQLPLEDLQPKIGAFKVKSPEPEPLMGNLVKLGFGNYATSYLEGYFNSIKNEKYAYGVHLKHLASRNGPVDKQNSGNGVNQLNVYGRYFMGKNEWNATMSYQRLRYHFYGYPDSLTFDKDDIEQLFHVFNAKIGVLHKNVDSKINYNTQLDFNGIRDHFSAKEMTGHLGGNVSYTLDDLSKIALDADIYLSKRSDAASLSRTYFQALPAYVRKHEKYLIKAGANFAYDNDTIGKSGFHLYPVAHVDIRIEEPHEIHAYVGVDGKLERMSYLKIVQENPFIASNAVVNNQNNTLRLYAGARATVKKYIALNGEFSLNSYKNFMHYINDSLQSSKFSVVYDKGNTSVVRTAIEAMYRKSEVFGTGIKLDGNFYSASTFDKIYHRPNFQTHYLMSYKFKNKVQINSDIYYISGIFAYNFKEHNSQKLNTIVDINLKTTYFFNQKLSAFVELNNLLSKSYQYYQYYPTKKLNFLIGAAYVF